MEPIGILIVLCASLWRENAAVMLPTSGECHESFIDVYPPRLMEIWYVMMHTDSLLVIPMPDCLMIKFGRRMSFNSEFRMDIVYSRTENVTEAEVTLTSLRGEVNVPGREPFEVEFPLSPVFPKNIMLTDFDENSGCMAFWSCADVGSSLIQKGAWVMCQSLDVEQEVVTALAEKVAVESGIQLSNFNWTNYKTCI